MRAASRWALLAACLLALTLALPARAQQYAFQHLRQEQGLENLAVTALVQDGAGQVWIGSENGLYRFDGVRMRRFGAAQGLVDARVIALHVDASGLLWVGTRTMLFHSNGSVFEQVLEEGKSIALQPGQSLASTRDRTVANTRHGLRWLSRGPAGWQASEVFGAAERARQPELGDIHGLLAAPGGDLWFGCRRALCHLAEGRLRLHQPAGRALPEPLTSLLRTADGRLWLRSPQWLWRLDAGAESLQGVDLPAAGEAPPPWSPALLVDDKQRVLTQWDAGVGRWDGSRWELIGPRRGLQAGGGVSALLLAADGGVWLGTAGAGLVHWLGYRHARGWSQAEGLPSDDSWAFLRTRAGAMYFGTAAGLAVRLDESSPEVSRIRTARRRPEFASSLVEDAQGRVWVASLNGMLGVLDPRSRQLQPLQALPRVTRMLLDLRGQLWIVTHQGIYLLRDPVHDRLPRRIDEGLQSSASGNLDANGGCVADDGRVWISTEQGLLVGDGQHVTRVRVLDGDGRLPAGQGFLAMACGRGRLWVSGADEGLWEGHPEPDGTLRLQRVVTPLLDGRMVLALHEDRRGWLWAATDYGVAVRNGDQWRFIRQDGGLPWNDCNQGALYEDRDGSMWVGTSRGGGPVP